MTGITSEVDQLPDGSGFFGTPDWVEYDLAYFGSIEECRISPELQEQKEQSWILKVFSFMFHLV